MDNNRFIYFIEERLTIYLMLLKIGPNLKGHKLIKDGVKKILEDSSKKFRVNSRLYTEIANENNITPELVDRAIRHSIEVSFKRNGFSEFEKKIKIDFISDKPTPREMLCTLAEALIVEKNIELKKKNSIYV